MKNLKGIVHVHSSYSYDGQHSLEEIARHGAMRGYSFIGMSEHSDTLNEEKMAQHVKDCEEATTSDCLIIPGIEFTCENNLHLVGLGVQHYTDTKDPWKVSEFIRRQNGIAVFAHPRRYNYQIPAKLADVLHGIEVWNAGYDGRFVPNDRSLGLLKDFRSRNEKLLAFGSEDLHRITNRSHVELVVCCERLEKIEVLRALKEGMFKISNEYFELDAQREPSGWSMAKIKLGRRAYTLATKMRSRLGW
jgi:hypothetical protein